ncbi:DNA cytosine methyltransferase [Symbiopectobacterium sp. RP]
MMAAVYYNEIDPYAAQWLRNLIAAGHIAPGDVDERSIEDVTPDDLQNYTQCHFFAGIGVWSYALRKAGWPDDKPVWTGSCPCQPFSAAGKGGGFYDERHLWPAFHWLISQCRPEYVFGEQVASSHANLWFDLVQADLEAVDYAFGCVPFPSAGVGAPHIRDRAYWVAYADHAGREGWQGMPECAAQCIAGARSVADNPSAVNGFWREADWLLCRDEKWRPVEPGAFPLAYGVTNRVGRLRAYGNAINVEAAKAFIESYTSLTQGEPMRSKNGNRRTLTSSCNATNH